MDRRLAVYNIGHGDRIAVLAGSSISDAWMRIRCLGYGRGMDCNMM